MKKIIAAFDGLRFSESTLHYALSLSKAGGAKLVGLFLEDPYIHGYGLKDLMRNTKGSLSKERRRLDKLDAKTRAQAIKRFQDACNKAGVEPLIRREHRLAMAELVDETRYADLLVISSHEALKPHRQKEPVEFIHALLPESRCPVLIVPATPAPIRKSMILYDGREPSLQALKPYSNLLGESLKGEAELVTVYPGRKSARLTGGALLKEYLKLHFENFRLVSLEGNAGPVLEKYLSGEGAGTLIVMGAYQRNRISRWLKPSLADRLMRKLEVPLFISHS